MKERYFYLDVLKGIAIICVCAYHFSWANGIGYQETMELQGILTRILFGINCICVPMFFMVNGALVLNKEYHINTWLKNMAVIVLQCIAWRFISIVVIGMANGINLMEHGGRYFLNAVFFGEYETINLSHMWFIYALIIVYLLMPFMKMMFEQIECKENYLIPFLLIICVLCFATKTWITVVKIVPLLGGIEFENIRNFLPFDGMYGPMLCYFILGGILHKKRENVKNISNLYLGTAFAAGAVFLYIKWYVESKSQGYTYDNVFFGYDCIAGFVITASLFIIVMKWEEKIKSLGDIIKKAISFVGRNTMNVYYIHWILGMVILPTIYEKIKIYDGMILNTIKALLLVISCSVIGEIAGRIPVLRLLFNRKILKW